MHIKHVNKISEQDNKALRSALTAALSTIIQVKYNNSTICTIIGIVKINIS